MDKDHAAPASQKCVELMCALIIHSEAAVQSWEKKGLLTSTEQFYISGHIKT